MTQTNEGVLPNGEVWLVWGICQAYCDGVHTLSFVPKICLAHARHMTQTNEGVLPNGEVWLVWGICQAYDHRHSGVFGVSFQLRAKYARHMPKNVF